MPGCCSGARSVVIEATVLRVKGQTFDRCSDTLTAVRTASAELEAELAPMNIPVTFVEHATTSERLPDSNTLLINGRALEEWIGAERVQTDCPSCGDLIGQSACCSAVSTNGVVSESVTVERVRDAALAALGLAGGWGCG
jgi:hypothetical protein